MLRTGIISLAFALFWAVAAPSHAAFLTWSGIAAVPPFGDGTDSDLVNNDDFLGAANELQGVTLSSDLTVNTLVTGAVTVSGAIAPTTATIPAGTVVNSHFVEYDRADGSGGGNVTDTMTFGPLEQVIALIWADVQLDASDAVLGLPVVAVNYPTGTTGRRMIENPEGTDTVSVSADRRTVDITMQVGDVNLDNLRIITTVVPEPSSFVIVGLMAVGLFGLSRSASKRWQL